MAVVAFAFEAFADLVSVPVPVPVPDLGVVKK